MFTFSLSTTGKLSFLGATGEVLAWKIIGMKELGKGHTGGTALTCSGDYGRGVGSSLPLKGEFSLFSCGKIKPRVKI